MEAINGKAKLYMLGVFSGAAIMAVIGGTHVQVKTAFLEAEVNGAKQEAKGTAIQAEAYREWVEQHAGGTP